MSPERKFDLGDYVEVKDRIKLFYELYAGGRLVTGEVRLSTEPDGKPRVLVQGLAYRTVDDPFPGIGWSWMELPGSTSYTKGSELENTETSAWGRAIASLGILVDRSIASQQEVDNKASDGEVRVEHDPTSGLIGKAELAKDSPGFLPNVSEEGGTLTFKLRGDKGGIKVLVHGDLAYALAPFREEVIGQRVTCWGRISDESFTPRNSKKEVTYQVLTLSKIQTPTFTLPADVPVEDASPVDTVSVPAFSEDELAGVK